MVLKSRTTEKGLSMKHAGWFVGLCLLAVAEASALENTEANRLTQANRYLEATPPEEMIAEMSQHMAKTLPEEVRGEFIKLITESLDTTILRTAMINAMVKHFTADELQALADFYTSPIGKSAMKKFGPYMAEVMPKIQKEVTKAVSAFTEQQSQK